MIAKNKKAYFDYEILDTFEAGVVLNGPEVKSIKNKRVNLKGGFVVAYNGELMMTNVHISPYAPAVGHNTDPTRSRKLLLHKKQIESIITKLDTKGISCVPLEIFLHHNLIKVKIGLVRGKKMHDKRQSIKGRQEKRNLSRALKTFVRK